MLLQEREARREWHQRPHHNQRDGNVRRFVSRIETRAKLTRDVDPRREKQPFLNASGQVFHHEDYPCDQKKGSGYDGPHLTPKREQTHQQAIRNAETQTQ